MVYEYDSPYDTSRVFEYRGYLPDGREFSKQVKVNKYELCESPAVYHFAKQRLLDEVDVYLSKFVREGGTMPIAENRISRRPYEGTFDSMYIGNSTYTYSSATATNTFECVTNEYAPTYGETGNYWSISRDIVIEVEWGKRILQVRKQDTGGSLRITQEDIDKAKIDYIRDAKVTILKKRAERKAEDLLSMMVDEVDFRSYKKHGYFIVKSGSRVFRVWKDNHKHIDMWERREDGLYTPKNRLCVHTQTREVPLADEALTKLLLIRSGKVLDRSNHHGFHDGQPMSERELQQLVLV